VDRELIYNSRRNRKQPDIDNHLLGLFIGEKKQNYYIRKWSKGLNSWNWAAFFFSLFWLGYRKMYNPIILILGIYLVIDLIVTILGIDDTVLNSYLGLAVGVTFGITGNNTYRLHAIKRIRKMMESNPTNPELLHDKIQLRGGPSWKGFFASVGLFSIYILLAMSIFSFVPSINHTVESEVAYDIEFDVIEVLEDNIQALQNEHFDDYMAMVYIDDDQTIYEETVQMVRGIFERFDLAYEISDYEFLSISQNEVKVRVTQTTTLVDGEDFRNNESVFIHTLRPQKGKWKFFDTEVVSVSYLDEDKSVQNNVDSLSNEPTYITLHAPSMFDFIITNEIDLNNDGTLEIVSFNGGPEESSNYMNENVEIKVEFDTGEIFSVPVSAENPPILYLYDINLDGWMEFFYETGARITGTDMYQFTPDGLEYVDTFNGAIEKLNAYEVFTNEDYYTLDSYLKVTNR